MVKGKKDMRPLLLKVGVAFALSFAGFLYARFRTRRICPSPTPSPRCPSGESRIDAGGRKDCREEHRSNPTTPTSVAASVAPENYEDTSYQKVNIDTPAAAFASGKKSGEEEGFLLPEFNDLVLNEFGMQCTPTISPRKDVGTPTSLRRVTDRETEQEITNLKNMVRSLRERERKLEIQLLEYYGLKEQETAVMELQNRLKINNMEVKLFSLKIESLEAENQRLKAKAADYTKVVAELESARMKIKLLKRKIRSDGEQTKEKLSTLEQKVADLQDQELGSLANDEDFQNNLERFKELEDQTAELRMANSRLQNENSELARSLESTQILAAAVLEFPEAEGLQEVDPRLRQENSNLTNEMERLQANHSADVEELVYLRWVNACLRYELRNYQAPPGKTVARDLSKTLSPKSEEKAKQLILEYANSEGGCDKGSLMDFDSEYWLSSQHSNLTESVEFDDSSLDISSATRTSNSKKLKFFHKLRKLVHGKESPKDNQSSPGDSGTTISASTSGRVESLSGGSLEEMVGTFTASSASSQRSVSMSSIDLMAIEARADERRSKLLLPPSHGSTRPSLDIQRIRNQSLDDIKNIECNRKVSDVGSSYSYTRKILREGVSCGLQQDSRLDQDTDVSEKLELMKFAEALKGSNGSPKLHRRGLSYSSY